MNIDAENKTVLENLTNAHNALSDVVNKHIECTTSMEKLGNTRDVYYSAMLEYLNARVSILSARSDAFVLAIVILSALLVISFAIHIWSLT